MDPRAQHDAAQTLFPRRRPRQPSAAKGSGDAPAPGATHDQNAPDSPPLQARQPQRLRLSLRQRRHAATAVPIAPPKVEPLSSRPVPRSRFSLPERSAARGSPPPPFHSFSSHEQHSFPELSSSLSSSSSHTSSTSSLLTVLADEDETCESSLSEPDVFEEKRDGDMVSVPAGAKVREFVGEGSANVVVGIELPEGTPIATRRFFEGKLLRLQKVPDNPEKRPYPYPEQYRYWREHIKPFFSDTDDLVSVDLVHLGPGGPQLLDDVSDLLRLLDDASEREQASRDSGCTLPGLNEHVPKRKKKFRGSKLARVEYAMLVDDMRVDEKDGIMIEMKPKWLFQSPSAPHAALRCRTCAVRLHRRLRDPAYDAADLPCPLLMTSDDWEDRSSFVSALVPEDEQDAWYVPALARWFKATPSQSGPKRLLAQLRGVQQLLDAKGPLAADPADEDFRLAMTLRDCSIFLRVLKRGGGQAPKVVAKIADLDKKNSGAKSAYWRRTEAELVRGGAYTAAYRVDARAGRVVPVRTGCLVERGARAGEWREFEVLCGEKDHNRLLTEKELEGYLQRC